MRSNDFDQNLFFTNCRSEKPEKAKTVPGQKTTLHIWFGGDDGAAWIMRRRAAASTAPRAASRVLSRWRRPRRMRLLPWLGIAEMSRPVWHAPGLLALQRLGFDDPPVSPPPPVLTFDTANLEARATMPGVVVGRV